MQRQENESIGLMVRDSSGQRRKRVAIPPDGMDATMAELLPRLVHTLKLPLNGTQGEPLSYQARLAKAGRNILPGEKVSDSLQQDDEVVLHRNIDAG